MLINRIVLVVVEFVVQLAVCRGIVGCYARSCAVSMHVNFFLAGALGGRSIYPESVGSTAPLQCMRVVKTDMKPSHMMKSFFK